MVREAERLVLRVLVRGGAAILVETLIDRHKMARVLGHHNHAGVYDAAAPGVVQTDLRDAQLLLLG